MSLLRDVTVSELQTMRDQGMSNREIADSLDVSYNTVLKLIGKQPKGVRSPMRYKVNLPAYKSLESGQEACLVVADRTVSLAGKARTYDVVLSERRLRISDNDSANTLEMSLDDIDVFINELSAIRRHMKDDILANEMW